LKTDIQKTWISMLISVDFWKSMYGHAMEGRELMSVRKAMAHSLLHPPLG